MFFKVFMSTINCFVLKPLSYTGVFAFQAYVMETIYLNKFITNLQYKRYQYEIKTEARVELLY